MADLKTGSASYPVSKDTATLNADGVDAMVAAHFNGPALAIVAIENELGTGLKGVLADLATRLNINMSTSGGLLYGTAFPIAPSNTPHWFWRTDLEKLYVYDITLASYAEVATTVALADYVSKTTGTTISAVHQFNPAVAGAPFTLGANGQNQVVTGLAAATATSATTATTATQLTDGTNSIRQKIVDIGDWNMDTTDTVTVLHGLNETKIRGINIWIRFDSDIGDGTGGANFFTGSSATIAGEGAVIIPSNQTTLLSLTRRTGGYFDSANFDMTSFNRGWITITYVV
jgi:hypothetical protein